MLCNRNPAIRLATVAGAFLFILSALPVSAQSFNIDLNKAGFPSPSNSFAAAAGQPGYWNTIEQAGFAYTLDDLNGQPGAVTLEISGAVNPYHDFIFAGSNFAALMEDMFTLPVEDDSLFFDFDGLEEGPYFLYTYSENPNTAQKDTVVTVNLANQKAVGGGFPDMTTFTENITHTRHLVHVGSQKFISVRVANNPNISSPHAVVNGFQLQQLASRLYVDAAAPAGGDGLSWATAFRDLQDALQQARDWQGAVEELWVAQGSYFPTAGTDRAVYFRAANGATMYGGFVAGAASLDERDPVAHPTFLSGNIGGPLSGDNSRNILQMSFTSGAANDAAVDGFTILGGNSDWNGAGLQVFGGALTVRNCNFINNNADIGGAVFATRGMVTFANCRFQGNKAATSGGAFASEQVDPNNPPSAQFINCRFLDNDGDFMAGAVDVQGGTASFVNGAFTGNDATWRGGAIHVANTGTSVDIRNCSMAGNTSVAGGGAVASEVGTQVEIVNSVFWDNHGGQSVEGQYQSQLVLGGSKTVTYSTVQYYASLLLPGVGNNGLDPQFVNPTGGDAYGGLNDDLRPLPGSPLIDAGANPYIGQDVADLDGDGEFIELTPLDLDSNPRQVDDPSTADTGFGLPPMVDRGAYEFQADVDPLGDMNCDGSVDLDDAPAMVLALTDIDAYEASFDCLSNGDFTADGSVNGADLQGFVGRLLN